ncbi:hypothetical protein ACEK07_46660 [Alcanivoracaceae bacterium MT1]
MSEILFARDSANEWRCTRFCYHGLVIVCPGGHEVAGWMDTLRVPKSWVPGCMAVDIDNNMWIATGGNDYDGAREWQRLDDQLMTTLILGRPRRVEGVK